MPIIARIVRRSLFGSGKFTHLMIMPEIVCFWKLNAVAFRCRVAGIRNIWDGVWKISINLADEVVHDRARIR